MVTNTPIPLPKGFQCSGIIAGIKESENKDLGLIFVENDAVVGAVYTQNKFPSVHVEYCRALTPTDKIRAIIVNSGNANAATGHQGVEGNLGMVNAVSELLKISPLQVLTSSTGIIGERFPIEIIEKAIPTLVERLNHDGLKFAKAILTTDLKLKTDSVSFEIDGKQYQIVGMAKGSGMIQPKMGTMLSYVMTDFPLPLSEIQEITVQAADRSFNKVTVDGDTSTNDSFYLISSAQTDQLSEQAKQTFQDALEKVTISLAKKIAADGEGAKHLIELTVLNASHLDLANSILHSVLNSPLVKTAIHGQDPNWGRILMAIGNGLAGFEVPDHLEISVTIQAIPVFTKGEPVPFDREELSEAMKADDIFLTVDLHNGDISSTGWSCDLSHGYITINADYTT
ncbi:MAG: glutamate N-acetyltransferase/amino-acid N-acetyltransferase [bacterium]